MIHSNCTRILGFEVLTTVVMKVITPCSLLKINRCFGANISLPWSGPIKPSEIPSEISIYVGSKRKNEERASVKIGPSWERMKWLDSQMTTERTNRRQEQEFRMALKGGGFVGIRRSFCGVK
jgi:hypothetical protein